MRFTIVLLLASCALAQMPDNPTGPAAPTATTILVQGAPGPTGPIGPAGPSGSDGAPGTPGRSINALISGGGVVWTTGLSFHVSAASYYINNVQYSSAAADITLDAADGANDRIDVIAVDSAGAVVILDGTAAAPPIPEVPDPATQLQLTFVYVAAKATTPSNITTDDVYHENTEWTSSRTGAPIVLASANTPIAGTYSVEATNSVTGNLMTFVAPAPFDPAIKNNLVFKIKSKAAWASTRSLQIKLMLSNANKGSIVPLANNQFGFDSSNTTTAQQIVIPFDQFAAKGLSVDRIRITTSGTGTAIGFWIDDIILQSGLAAPVAPSGLTWCGAWVATTAYPVNCQVTYSNATWVAMAGSTNSAPSLTNTNWAMTNPGPLWDAGPSTDHTVSGATARLTAGAALTFGQVCYMGSDGKMELADASVIATAGAWAMVADATIAENATGNFLLHGFARDDTWNWGTLGSLLVLDITTAGNMLLIASAPSGANEVIQVLGTAVTADVVYFNPSLVQVEHQ